MPINLNRMAFVVSANTTDSVVGAGTRLELMQKGERIFGRYAGGRIERGTLVGRIRDRTLVFRYAQRESSGEIHAGRSTCEVRTLGGRVRIVEHYAWTTRAGTGVNVFDEV